MLSGIGTKRGKFYQDENEAESPKGRAHFISVSPVPNSTSSSSPPSKRLRKNNTNNEITLDEFIKQYENTQLTKYLLQKPKLPDPLLGGTSRVFQVKFILKRVNMSFSTSIYNEIRALSILNEANCNCAPRLVAVSKIHELVYLIMTYTEGKTLQDWLKTNPSEEQKTTRHKELEAALTKIHSFDIIHADIKPSNIWIPDDLTIPAYFIDFGSAIQVGEKANSFTTSPDGSPLESESATKEKDKIALNKLFMKKGGTRRNRKKLNHSRRHHRYY